MSYTTPLLEASKNLLKALKLLAKTPTDIGLAGLPTAMSTNHAIEYEKHLEFFRQVEDFEDSYPLWYKFEREARLDMLMENVVFNWSKYASRVDVILQSHRALLDDRICNPINKFPRSNNAADIASQSKPSSQFFREISPACLLCAKAHQFSDHPANVVCFNDGRPLYSRLVSNQLVVTKIIGSIAFTAWQSSYLSGLPMKQCQIHSPSFFVTFLLFLFVHPHPNRYRAERSDPHQLFEQDA